MGGPQNWLAPLQRGLDGAEGEPSGLERAYLTLIGQLPAAIYLAALDETGSTLFMSPHASLLYDRPIDDFVADPALWSAVIHAEDRARVEAEYQAAIRRGDPFRVEYRIVRPDRSVRHVRDEAALVRDEAGAPLMMQGVVFDVTAEHETAEELRRSRDDLARRVRDRNQQLEALEARYRALVDGVPAVLYLDEIARDGSVRPVFISPRVEALVGHRPEELLHSQADWYALLHPDDRDRVEREDRGHYTTKGELVREYRILARDGRVVWVLDHCTVFDAPGGVRHDQGVLLDITARREAEAEAARVIALHEAVLRSVGDGIYGLDHDGVVTFMNPAGIELLGWTVEAVVGRRFHELSHHTRADGTPFPVEECPIYAVLRDGRPRRVEEDVFWRSDGTSIPVAYSVTPMVATGGPGGAVVTFEDISERVAARRALLEANQALERHVQERTRELEASEARWRSLIGSAPEIVLTLDRAGGIGFINRVVGGFEMDQVVGKKLFDFIPQRQAAAVRRSLEQAFSQGASQPYEVSVTHPDGTVAWYETRLARVGEDEVVGFTADVTDRREIQSRREAELAVARLLADAGDATAVIDGVLEAMGTAIGAQLAELWLVDDSGQGLTREGYWAVPTIDTTEIDAQSGFVATGEGGLAALAWESERALWLAEATAHPLFVRRAAFERVGLHGMLGVPLRVGERVLGAALFFYPLAKVPDAATRDDATALGLQLAQALGRSQAMRELVAARVAAEAANRAKSELLARLSHELRTPLNAILGFGQLLELAELKAEDRDSVQHIMQGGRRLLGLIDRVLDIVRLDTGRITLAIEPIAMAGVVKEAVAATYALARDRAVTVEVRPDDPGTVALADRHRVATVLRTLLDNAIRHGPEGGTVRVSVSQPTDDRCRITVRDDGPGIPADRVERIFKPLEAAVGTRTEGAGVSLALARRLAMAMGGELSLDTSGDDGTSFWLELPASGSAAAAATVAATDEPAEGAWRVLYIEDNLANLRLVERTLAARAELRIDAAMTGRAGLDLARRSVPDLILLDAGLPDMDGLEVLRELRADDRTRAAPVVIVSSLGTEQQREQVFEAGGDAFLQKPLDTQSLTQTIVRLIERHRALK